MRFRNTIFVMDPYNINVIKLEENGWFLGSEDIVPKTHVMSSGILSNFPTPKTRSELFLRIFDINIRKNFVDRTNHRLHDDPGSSTGRYLTDPEFLKFLAIRFRFRVNHRRELDDYWSPPALSTTGPDVWVTSRMNEHRFCALNTHLRFDYEFVCDRLISNSLALRQPSTVIAFDETMVPFLGSGCDLAVFVPNKPHPRGIEFIDMCDSTKFCCGLSLVGETSRSHVDRMHDMLGKLADPGRHRFYFDRGYGTESLAVAIMEQYGCEFVMKCPVNKPDYLFRKALSRAALLNGPLLPATAHKAIAGRVLNAVSGIRFVHHRPVVSNFLTNCWGAQLTSPTSGILSCEANYHKSFFYVDRFDHIILANGYPHRHSTVDAAIADFVLSVALQNALVIYKEQTGTLETLRSFIEHVASELSPDPSTAQHRLESMRVRRHCAQCEKSGQRSNTTLCCAACFGQPALHVRCFELYHQSLQVDHL